MKYFHIPSAFCSLLAAVTLLQTQIIQAQSLLTSTEAAMESFQEDSSMEEVILPSVEGPPEYFMSIDDMLIAPSDTSYGTLAYSCLETLVSSYPYRTNLPLDRSEAVDNAGLWIKDELSQMGYTVQEDSYLHGDFSGINYYVTKPGLTNQIITIGAHYDCADTTGTDDNASGVSVLLELANRFRDVKTSCTLQFVFFDNEEEGGYVGSFRFIEDVLKPLDQLDNVLCMINLDSIGAGDKLFAYGGTYSSASSSAALQQIWPYNLAMSCAQGLGIELATIPTGAEDRMEQWYVDEYQESGNGWQFRTPTRVRGSDQFYFVQNNIPYLYLEASLWENEDGTGGNEKTHLTCHYQTADPAFASTGGKIMHTDFDDLTQLNTLLPGRVLSNLSNASMLVSELLMQIDPAIVARYDYNPFEEETSVAATDLQEETSADQTETSVVSDEEETTEEVILPSDHHMITTLFISIALILLIPIFFVIYHSTINARRRKRRRIHLEKYQKKDKKK